MARRKTLPLKFEEAMTLLYAIDSRLEVDKSPKLIALQKKLEAYIRGA